MLSIILPVLNEAEQIVASLVPLQALRAGDVELIVVDGGSNDDTAKLAAPLADRLVHAHRGRARQMNAGAALAKGDILLFLHADTKLPGNALNAMQDVREGLASPAHAWGRFDVRIDGRSRMFVLIAALMNLRSRITGIATGDQAIFVRRDVFDAVGGFPEQPLMEDIELSRLLKSRTKPLCLREKVTTSGRRWEKYGIWRTIVLMWRLRLLYWMGTPAERLAKAYR
ncbi:TIGR04283 family arsenosugar biosynthesis glycosyltransferase [Noviherbaspirillum sp.]|uniref:TIGR04283 family arsenosugar biosynthesis glycosyltransferase n=1 Tax=Noviherbaspirillum sp. TaxID=1926288 RepID=UPI002FDF89C9